MAHSMRKVVQRYPSEGDRFARVFAFAARFYLCLITDDIRDGGKETDSESGSRASNFDCIARAPFRLKFVNIAEVHLAFTKMALSPEGSGAVALSGTKLGAGEVRQQRQSPH